jgi:hypothetical protein
MPGVAAAAYLKARRTAAAAGPAAAHACGWRCLATPLHYVAEMSNVRLAPDGLLNLQEDEAATLARDFGRIWNDSEFRLEALGSMLFCASQRSLSAGQWDPERVLGSHLHEFLPTGQDAAALKRLMSEMEMWLFDHAVNVARRGRAAPPISALWLWGGAPPLEVLPATRGCAAGDDVFFSAFAAEEGLPKNVMVVQEVLGADTGNGAQSRWLQEALEALRLGVITRLYLSSGTRRFLVTRRWRRRIFRRTKPWWEYFD